MFNLNVLGLLLTSQEAAKHFGYRGSSSNISSVVSTIAPSNGAVYSATKAAVDAVTTSLAKELGSRHIRVNAINPGLVETEGIQTAGFSVAESEGRQQTEAQTRLVVSDNRRTSDVWLFSSPLPIQRGSLVER